MEARVSGMLDDEQAVTRLKAGDLSGLEELVGRYYLRAVRAAYLVTLDHNRAEDAAQDAFVHLERSIRQYDARRPFAPWFLRCVVNAAINAGQRDQRTVSLDAQEFSAVDWLVALEPGPEAQVLAGERAAAVRAALAKLSPQQRAAVVMRYYLELSEAEMAAGLAAPVSSLKWWLFTARGRLRELLQGFAPASGDAGKEDR
jgi:RNA polymerase sigma-70 factor, ECF subfamily